MESSGVDQGMFISKRKKTVSSPRSSFLFSVYQLEIWLEIYATTRYVLHYGDLRNISLEEIGLIGLGVNENWTVKNLTIEFTPRVPGCGKSLGSSTSGYDLRRWFHSPLGDTFWVMRDEFHKQMKFDKLNSWVSARRKSGKPPFMSSNLFFSLSLLKIALVNVP